MTGLYLLVLVISVAVPGAGYLSLFSLALLPVFHRLVTPRLAARLGATSPASPDSPTV